MPGWPILVRGETVGRVGPGRRALRGNLVGPTAISPLALMVRRTGLILLDRQQLAIRSPLWLMGKDLRSLLA